MYGGWNGLPVAVFGAGATSKEVEIIIKRVNEFNNSPVFNFLGFISKHSEETNCLCAEEDLYDLIESHSAMGLVIPLGDMTIRERIYLKYKNIKGLVWPNIIDPGAKLIQRDSVHIGIGNIIEFGAVVNMNSTIGSFNLININAIIGHDNHIGDFCTISPGAVLSGNVMVEDNALIGAGAVVKQNLKIGRGAALGLGAFTVNDIAPGKILVCEKPQELKRSQ